MGSITEGDSQAVMLIVVLAVFWVLALAAVILRVWARSLKKIPYVINDYAVFFAMIFATLLVGIGIVGAAHGGLGRHASLLSTEELVFSAKVLVIAELAWAFANLGIKISILHLFNLLFWNSRPFQIASHIVLVLSVCTALAAILSDLLFYRPVAYAWGARIDGTCGDIITTYLAITIVNLLVDLSIVILPLPMLWNFQMPLFKKVGVYLMFSIGIINVY